MNLAIAQMFQITNCSSPLGSVTYGPMNSTTTANATNRTAVIYPAGQITGAVGTITNVFYERISTSGSMAGTPTFKIYLKEVAATDWTTADLDWAAETSTATLVFDGNPAPIVGSSEGWKNFPLTTNFVYSGTQNLAVFTEYVNTTALASSISWSYEYTAPCINTSNSNTTKYINNTTGTPGALLSSENYRRPIIGFDLLLTCYPPTGVTSSTSTSSSVNLEWTAPAAPPANGYEYYYSSTNTAPLPSTPASGSTLAGVTNATVGSLTAGTQYYFWVRSVCSGSDKSPWSQMYSVGTLAANDECANAVSLTVGATCVNTAGSTVGATQSQAAAPCTGNPDDDVWFSFVANNTDAQITISSVVAVVGSSTDMYFQVLDGSCGSLTSLMCSDPNTGIVGGLTPGNTYYIRVYSFATTSRQTFNICVNDLATAPTVCTSLSAPANGAQVSTSPTLTWTATANASGYDIYLDANNPPTTLYASRENGSSTSYTVSPPLSSGTYYWYVVPRNSLGEMAGCETNTRNFIAVAPPANDECATATVLTPSGTTACNAVAGTTVGATQSTQAAPSCSAAGINDDVWYSFTATGATHSVAITGATNTTAVAAYTGADCSTLTQITGACASTSSGNIHMPLTGLTVGTVYYLRVYTTVSTSTTTSNFNICITSPPANDECSGAITMPVTTNGSACINTSVSTAGATISTVTGQANTCTGTGIDDDVWYQFTSTFNGAYTFGYTGLTAIVGTASTVGMNVYTGTCGTLTEVASACSSGFGTGGTGSRTVTLVAGTTYYLRLSVGSSPNTGTFDFCITAPPTPAVNDECSGAIALPTASATATCVTPTAGTTAGGSQSADAAPSCSATGTNDDVWYSFVATATSHTVLITNATSTTAAAIYTGTCGTLTQVANACNSGGATASGLTIGATYYVRVYTTSTTVGTTSDFDICVVSGAPANDECAGAISLTASAGLTCGNTVSGTTVGATFSADVAPSCSGTGINDDVWYSFVATATTHTVLVSNANSTTAAAVYSGSCGSLTQVAGACGSGVDGSAVATGLTIGNTYYVRVYTTSAIVGTYSNFDICILSGVPANDDCAGAINIPVSTDNSCSNAVLGSTLGATATTGETVPGCSATGINDDVWYSFTATATTHTVSLIGSTNTAAVAVYSGTCGALTQLTGACASNNLSVGGLTIGAVYYVRVYTTSSTAGIYSNFAICVGVPITNDDCAGALPLTATTNGNCNAVFGTTVGATQTAGPPAPSCSATGINDDVWYSFVAAATTQVVSISNANSTTAAAVYSGTCASLTAVAGACASTTVTANGLTIGETYYVRVYTTVSTAGTFSTFGICVSGIPENNECAAATTLTANVTTTGNTAGATQSTAASTCSGSTATSANDVWYQFTASNNGAALVVVNNVASSLDPVVQAYSGTCGALTSIDCVDAGGSGVSETLVLNGLVAGQTYYIRVYGFSSTGFGTFDITVSGAALPVTIEYFKGNKQNSANRLEWKLACSNVNSATVELERSSDGRNFETVSTYVITAANCSDLRSYLDNQLTKSLYYYRLKITELDGRVGLSSTVALLGNQKGFELVAISPNPAHTTATLEVASAEKTWMEIIITDITGRKMQSRRVNVTDGVNKIPMQLASLGQGVYYVTAINQAGERKTTKLVKQ